MSRQASWLLLSTLSVLHFSDASKVTSPVDALQRTIGRLVSVEPHVRVSPAGNQSEPLLGRLVKDTDPRLYLLADPNPVCLAAMSSGDYCPTPSGDQHVTDLYMGAQDRAMFALVNALRVSPRDYSAVYGGSLGCAASPLPPFRYSSPLQQASKQASRILATPGCPMAHDTCSSWCHLYSSCSYLDRIPTYSDAFQEVGENLAVGFPYVVKVIASWMGSEGHCASIFYAPYNHMGAGYWRDDAVANTYKHFWITDFASMSTDAYAHHPIYSGSHVQLKTRGTPEYDTIRFLLTYFSTSKEASKATLVLEGSSYDLPLHLGSRTAGSFAADFGASDGGDCSKYYFQVEDATGAVHRLPEKGHYLTAGVGTCTRNYDDPEARQLEAEEAPPSTWALSSSSSSTAALSSYRYVGCRSLTARGMRGHALTSPVMTHALCDDHCRTQGLAYFGLSRDRCHCRASAPPADKAPLTGAEEEGACAHPCSGDQTQACGGPRALLWFKTV